MSAKKPESKIVDKIQTWVTDHQGTVIKNHGDVMAVLGTPDLIGGIVLNLPLRDDSNRFASVHFAVEVKVPGEEATELQQHRLDEWRKVGYETATVHSLGEFIEFVVDRAYANSQWLWEWPYLIEENKLYEPEL